MRSIIVRFRNKQDLDIIGQKLNIKLDSSVVSFDISKNLIKKKKNTSVDKPKVAYWITQWKNMPEYKFSSRKEYAKIKFILNDENLSDIFEQSIGQNKKSIWYPKFKNGLNSNVYVVGGSNPVFPIYVISKSRHHLKRMSTSRSLTAMCVSHFLVVEPDQFDNYVQNFKNEYCTVIKMDLSYKDNYDTFSDLGNNQSCGSGPARNFCWDHSIKNGHKFHWIMDDNLHFFSRFWNGFRVNCLSGGIFYACEQFVQRYSNIAISGLNYRTFVMDHCKCPAFTLNTRIYSCLLIKNDIPYRWRGRYNEDTDLSLRVLKGGFCTILFNAFLSGKRATQTIHGGNTEELYGNGTEAKSQMLFDMHPDLTKIINKYGRTHHQVDYSQFKQKPELIDFTNNESVNDFGMKIVRTPYRLNDSQMNKKFIESNFNIDEILCKELHNG